MINRYATTGTFWGNVGGDGENLMPAPIFPNEHIYGHSGMWTLVGPPSVTLVSASANDRCCLFITWTWKR